MAKLNITEAANVAGVARSTLYRAIKEGRLTRDPDGTIDTSELIRAGFTLHHATPSATSEDDSPYASPLHNATQQNSRQATQHLERLVATLERELEAAKAREAELLELLKRAALPPVRNTARDDSVLQRFKTWFWGHR
jgi:hypothetical protein